MVFLTLSLPTTYNFQIIRLITWIKFLGIRFGKLILLINIRCFCGIVDTKSFLWLQILIALFQILALLVLCVASLWKIIFIFLGTVHNPVSYGLIFFNVFGIVKVLISSPSTIQTRKSGFLLILIIQ